MGYEVLHSFDNTASGDWPLGGLTLGTNELYGATTHGGANGYGTIFKIKKDGSGYVNLKHFGATNEQVSPSTELLLVGDVLHGGAGSDGWPHSAPMVFKIKTDGSDFTMLKTFNEIGDAGIPRGRLAVSGTTLFGATDYGGEWANGAIFKVNTDGSEYLMLKELLFVNWQLLEGERPETGVIIMDDALYGTIQTGGAYAAGVVFRLDLGTPLCVSLLNNKLVLTWTNTNFHLQSAPECTDVFTNVSNAISPFTNSLTATRQFFRLQRD